MTQAEQREQIEALTLKYVLGQLSEPTFMVSLHRYCDIDDIRHIVAMNQMAHRNSMAYRRGEVA